MPDNKRIMISVENVGVSYKTGRSLLKRISHEIFHDLSFSICEGDSLGVIGRNGAGKSTLLRLLAGVIAPDVGEIKSDGVSSALLALGAGFNHQLDGRVNAVRNGMLLGFTQKEVEDRLDEITAFSEIGSAINDPVKTYSAGMRSRLAFSVAVHMRPDVLLIDEALGVGDAGFMKKSSKALHDRVRSKQTVVLVSHQAATIRALCNRVIWIEKGVLRRDGPAKEVLADYEDYITS